MFRQRTNSEGAASSALRSSVLVAVACLLFVLVVGLWWLSPLFRAASVLYSLSQHSAPFSVRAYNHVFGFQSTEKSLTIAGSERQPVSLRVYTPTNAENAPTIVILHGFAADGNRNEVLNAFAAALVRQGFRVVLPTLEAEAQEMIEPTDLTTIRETVDWASETSGGQKVSLFGVSFGGGLAITAAESSAETQAKVKLVLMISGYNDLSTISRYYIHDQMFGPNGRPYPREGPKGGAILFLRQYLDEMVSPSDRDAIRAAIDRMIAARRYPIKASDPVLQGLTPDQVQLFMSLENVDTPAVQEGYRQLIARHKAEMDRVSPRSVMSHLHTPLYILHASYDRDIPEGEVEWIRSELPPGADAHITVTPWMQHASVGQAVSWLSRLRVGIFLGHILSRAAH